MVRQENINMAVDMKVSAGSIKNSITIRGVFIPMHNQYVKTYYSPLSYRGGDIYRGVYSIKTPLSV